MTYLSGFFRNVSMLNSFQILFFFHINWYLKTFTISPYSDRTLYKYFYYKTLFLSAHNKWLHLSLLRIFTFLSVRMWITTSPCSRELNMHIKIIHQEMQRIFPHSLWTRQKFNFVYNIIVQVANRTHCFCYNSSKVFPNRGVVIVFLNAVATTQVPLFV